MNFQTFSSAGVCDTHVECDIWVQRFRTDWILKVMLESFHSKLLDWHIFNWLLMRYMYRFIRVEKIQTLLYSNSSLILEWGSDETFQHRLKAWNLFLCYFYQRCSWCWEPPLPIFFFLSWLDISVCIYKLCHFQDIMQSANLSKSWHFYLNFIVYSFFENFRRSYLFPTWKQCFCILPSFLCISSHFSHPPHVPLRASFLLLLSW